MLVLRMASTHILTHVTNLLERVLRHFRFLMIISKELIVDAPPIVTHRDVDVIIEDYLECLLIGKL